MEPDVQTLLQQALPRGYVAAFRWLGDREESRDACQEAAARVLARPQAYDPERPFYPWFYRILRNLCMDRLKGRQLGARADRELAATAAPQTETAEGRLLTREREGALERAIEGLPGPLREVIELRHFQDLSYEEMAHVLDCPQGTVMSRLYRARKALRQALAADERPGTGRRA
jgi:RNA polymerase sigma-70 factor (ECF subfamily)